MSGEGADVLARDGFRAAPGGDHNKNLMIEPWYLIQIITLSDASA
jgi:hypothetical protein